MRMTIVVAYPAGNKGIHCISAIWSTIVVPQDMLISVTSLYRYSSPEKKRIANTFNELVWLSNSYIVTALTYSLLFISQIITFVEQFTLAWARRLLLVTYFCQTVWLCMSTQHLLYAYCSNYTSTHENYTVLDMHRKWNIWLTFNRPQKFHSLTRLRTEQS